MIRQGWFQDTLIGVTAVLMVALYVGAAAALDDVGFPLDDAWIHQTYARNLAEHGEWAFVPGKASAASTSPLYTVLLAVGRAARLPFFVWTCALGALALATTGWIGSRLARRLFPDLAGRHVRLSTGLVMVVAWHNIWAAASGMETMVFGALSLLLIAVVWRERDLPIAKIWPSLIRGIGFGVLGAILTLTRPEGIGLVGLGGVVAVLVRLHQRDRNQWGQASLAWVSGALVGWLVGVLPYVAVNLSIEGALLPNTSAAKQAEYAIVRQLPLWERYFRLLLPLLAGGQFLLIPGMVIGVTWLFRHSSTLADRVLGLLPVAWAVMLLSAYAWRLPVTYQHGRYVMPMLPPLLLYGVGGTLIIINRARDTAVQRVLARSLGLASIALMVGFLAIGAQQYARDVRIINSEMVTTARWLAKNVPPDELLAVHDIGAVGYFAPRPILDLAGLVSPEVVPIISDHEALMRLMCEREVVYLMVFPDQRPARPDDPRLGTEWESDNGNAGRTVSPVFRTNSPYAVAAGGGNMAVYRMHWDLECE